MAGYVQSKLGVTVINGGVVPTTINTTYNSPNAAGNMLLVVVGVGAFPEASVVTDSNGNIYSLLCTQGVGSPGNARVDIWWCPFCVGGTNTVTLNITAGQVSCGIYEYSGPYSSVDDVATVPANGFSVSFAGPTFPPPTFSHANDLLFAVVLGEFGSTDPDAHFTLTPSTGWNFRDHLFAFTAFAWSTWDQIYASSGLYNLTATPDNLGAPYSMGLSLSLAGFTLGVEVSCNNPPEGTVTTPSTFYSHVFPASGGTPGYTWAITGTLPPGLAFDTTTGTLSGNPTTGGTYALTVTVTDSASATASVDCTITILQALCNNPPDGVVGVAYTTTFLGVGGSGYVFAISVGSLPPGITLNSSSGVASGTPTVAGSYPFTLQITDAATTVSNVDCSINITSSGGPISIDCGSPINATVGIPYTHTFPVTGDTPPDTFIVLSGALPPGLTLSATTGVLSGTPTTAGTYSFVIQVTDSLGNMAVTPTCSITAAPSVCNGFVLSKMVLWFRPASHMPVRGAAK